MNVTFTARHFEASTKLQEYSRDLVTKLEQFYDGIVACDIILHPTPKDEEPQAAEIILKVPDKILTAQESAETYEKALHDAVENLSRQLKKYKQKRFAKY